MSQARSGQASTKGGAGKPAPLPLSRTRGDEKRRGLPRAPCPRLRGRAFRAADFLPRDGAGGAGHEPEDQRDKEREQRKPDGPVRRRPGRPGIGEARHRERGEWKAQRPERQREGQPRELRRLDRDDGGEDIGERQQDMRHRSHDPAGEPQPGEEGHSRRRDQDHQRRLEPGRQRIVEHQPVEDQREQDHPEQQARREEEPRELEIAQRHACHRHDHVAHCRNEPGRVQVPVLERPRPDPAGNDRERQHALTGSSQQPQGPRRPRRVREQRRRDQEERDRDGRKEGEPHGVVPLLPDGPRPEDDLGPVEAQHDKENADRDGAGGRARDGAGAQRDFGRVQGQRQPRQPHHGGKEGDRKMRQAAFAGPRPGPRGRVSHPASPASARGAIRPCRSARRCRRPPPAPP